jgi:hypothetical protein
MNLSACGGERRDGAATNKIEKRFVPGFEKARRMAGVGILRR